MKKNNLTKRSINKKDKLTKEGKNKSRAGRKPKKANDKMRNLPSGKNKKAPRKPKKLKCCGCNKSLALGMHLEKTKNAICVECIVNLCTRLSSLLAHEATRAAGEYMKLEHTVKTQMWDFTVKPSDKEQTK